VRPSRQTYASVGQRGIDCAQPHRVDADAKGPLPGGRQRVGSPVLLAPSVSSMTVCLRWEVLELARPRVTAV
jgi:hypothetical protein